MTHSQEDNPWKTLASRQVYTNPWISLREDKVIRPDGKEGIYSVVETRVATGVVAVDEQGQVYLVGQYRYPIKRYSWEIIEGGAEINELPIEAAQRELKEEAGLVAAEWHELGPEVALSNCFSAEVAVFFLATGLTQGSAEPDGTEVLQVKKMAFEQALLMTENGEISDAMSIIALQRAHRFLK